MAIETVRTTRTSFDLKSASLPVVAVVLKTTDAAVLSTEWALRMAEAPGFFDNDPVLLDLGAVRESDSPLDFPAIVALLRSHHTMPVAVRGGNAAQMQAALAAGLTAAPEAAPVRTERRAPVATTSVVVPDSAPPAPDSCASPDLPPATPGLGTIVIDKPLRSGQQVYARGADLIVLAMVSFGAEVIADGNIHVYAPLRGRAMAGARGNIHARIFTTCMEPQLVSIAGIYRTTEVAIPADIVGKPAQVRLDGEKLLIEPL